MDAYTQIRLRITEDAKHRMESRQILEEDVQRVIHHAEATGEKLMDPFTGRFLASFRPDRVTFWVEYSEAGEVYEIHSAYSHRMEMKRKGKP